MRFTRKGKQAASLAVVLSTMLFSTSLVATERDAEAEAAYQERVQTIIRDAYLSKALNRSAKGLVSKRMPDGSVMLSLGGGFQHAMLARINADGELETQCHDDLESAAKFLAGGGGRLTGHKGHDHEK